MASNHVLQLLSNCKKVVDVSALPVFLQNSAKYSPHTTVDTGADPRLRMRLKDNGCFQRQELQSFPKTFVHQGEVDQSASEFESSNIIAER